MYMTVLNVRNSGVELENRRMVFLRIEGDQNSNPLHKLNWGNYR